MKKVLLGLALAAGTLGAVGAANAATVYAQSVVEVTPGVRPVTPAPVDYVGPNRYTPENILGAPDETFYSLGKGGSIVVDFGQLVRSPGTAIEVTFNRLAGGLGLESFDIYVSATLDFLGAAVASLTNEFGSPGPRGLTYSFTFDSADFQYVKLVDTTPQATQKNRTPACRGGSTRPNQPFVPGVCRLSPARSRQIFFRRDFHPLGDTALFPSRYCAIYRNNGFVNRQNFI